VLLRSRRAHFRGKETGAQSLICSLYLWKQSKVLTLLLCLHHSWNIQSGKTGKNVVFFNNSCVFGCKVVCTVNRICSSEEWRDDILSLEHWCLEKSGACWRDTMTCLKIVAVVWVYTEDNRCQEHINNYLPNWQEMLYDSHCPNNSSFWFLTAIM